MSAEQSNPHEQIIRDFAQAATDLDTRLRSYGWEPGRCRPAHFTLPAVTEAWESFGRDVESIIAPHAADSPWVFWQALAARCRGAWFIIPAYADLSYGDAIRRTVEGLWQLAEEIGGVGHSPPSQPRIDQPSDGRPAVAELLVWAEAQNHKQKHKVRKDHPRPNEARDTWIARQREKKNPVSWEDIYTRLLEVGEEKKWNIPNDAKALSEAYRRKLDRDRKRKAK